jgi:4-oxalocrotonate tautomerase
MPFIDVTLGTGRSPEQVRRLIHELTEAAHRAVGAPRTAIRVCVREVLPEHWAAGDVTTAERDTTGTTDTTGSTSPTGTARTEGEH